MDDRTPNIAARPMLAELVARSRQNTARSQALRAHSLALAVLSRALLRYSDSPCGASDIEIPSQGARTLAKIRRGRLPVPTASKAWVERGSLQACSGCGDKIVPEELEYGVEFPIPEPAVSLRFHGECYRVWLASQIGE